MPKFPVIIRIEEIERRLHDREGKYNDQIMTMLEKRIEEEKDQIPAENFDEFKQKVIEFANMFEYWMLFKDEKVSLMWFLLTSVCWSWCR